MDTREFRKMTPSERLATIEAIWDTLLEEETEVPSPDWHRDVLEDRKQKIESGTAEFLSLQKLRESRQP